MRTDLPLSLPQPLLPLLTSCKACLGRGLPITALDGSILLWPRAEALGADCGRKALADAVVQHQYNATKKDNDAHQPLQMQAQT